MSLQRTVLYNTFVQFLGRFGASGLGFITTLLIARTFGAAGYGAYAKAYTLSAFFYLFVDFGLNAVYIRKHKDNVALFPLLAVLRSILFVISLVCIALFLLITYGRLFVGTDFTLAALFVITVLFYGYFISFNAIFQIKSRYDLSVAANIVGGLSGLILLWFLIPYGIVAAAVSVVAGYILTVFIAYMLAKRVAKFSFFSLKGISRPELIRFFKEAAPIGLMLFVNTMYFRADIFIIGLFEGNTQVGIYQLAYKFFEFPLSFATFFANSTFPHYVKLYEQDKKKFFLLFRRAGLFLGAAASIFTVGALMFAPILALVRKDYLPSIPVLQVLAWSYPIFFLTSPISWLLFIQKKEKHLLFIYVTAMLLNIVLNTLFVPRFGFIAAAYVTILSELFVLSLMLLVVKKTSHVKHS